MKYNLIQRVHSSEYKYSMQKYQMTDWFEVPFSRIFKWIPHNHRPSRKGKKHRCKCIPSPSPVQKPIALELSPQRQKSPPVHLSPFFFARWPRAASPCILEALSRTVLQDRGRAAKFIIRGEIIILPCRRPKQVVHSRRVFAKNSLVFSALEGLFDRDFFYLLFFDIHAFSCQSMSKGFRIFSHFWWFHWTCAAGRARARVCVYMCVQLSEPSEVGDSFFSSRSVVWTWHRHAEAYSISSGIPVWLHSSQRLEWEAYVNSSSAVDLLTARMKKQWRYIAPPEAFTI